MSKRQRRKLTGAYKSQVAIAALKERETLAELSKRFSVHATMISKWKQELIERSGEIFETKGSKKDNTPDIEKLYAKIGQLEMECDYLKKISKMAGV
jgi:transposase